MYSLALPFFFRWGKQSSVSQGHSHYSVNTDKYTWHGPSCCHPDAASSPIPTPTPNICSEAHQCQLCGYQGASLSELGMSTLQSSVILRTKCGHVDAANVTTLIQRCMFSDITIIIRDLWTSSVGQGTAAYNSLVSGLMRQP